MLAPRGIGYSLSAPSDWKSGAPVAAAPFAAIDGVRDVVEEGRTLRMLVTGPIAPVVRLAAQYELDDFVSREPSLEEVFLSEYVNREAVAADPTR